MNSGVDISAYCAVGGGGKKVMVDVASDTRFNFGAAFVLLFIVYCYVGTALPQAGA